MTNSPIDPGYQSNPGEGAGAKERAQQATDTAKEEGRHVAGTAKDEARNVASEAAGQARSVLNDTLGQVSEQSRTQQQRVGGTLHTFGDDLEQMAGQGSPGMASDLVREVATRARSLGSQLQDREPEELLADLRGFARRRPGTFLLGALAAGVVAGRLARGTADGVAAATGSPSPGVVPSAEDTRPSMPPAPPVPPREPTVAPPLGAPGPMGGPEAGYGERGAFEEPTGERGLR